MPVAPRWHLTACDDAAAGALADALKVPAIVATTSAFAVNNPAVELLIVNVHVNVSVPNPAGVFRWFPIRRQY